MASDRATVIDWKREHARIKKHAKHARALACLPHQGDAERWEDYVAEGNPTCVMCLFEEVAAARWTLIGIEQTIGTGFGRTAREMVTELYRLWQETRANWQAGVRFVSEITEQAGRVACQDSGLPCAAVNGKRIEGDRDVAGSCDCQPCQIYRLLRRGPVEATPPKRAYMLPRIESDGDTPVD